MKNFYLITLFMCLSNLQAWATGSSEKAVYDLIERVTPGYASQYRLVSIFDVCVIYGCLFSRDRSFSWSSHRQS